MTITLLSLGALVVSWFAGYCTGIVYLKIKRIIQGV